MPLNERGSALVAAAGVLSMLTLLATMSLMAGGADLMITTRLARERAAFYAAESALETTLQEIVSAEGPVPEASFHAPWPAPGVAVRSWQDGPWACSRRICLIPDDGDADADAATTVVLFNRSFGHGASPLLRGGYPVLQLLVTAAGSESRHAIVAEVAPVTCAPVVAAAWTTAGPLHLSGDIRVGGATGLAAMAARVPVLLSDGAVIDGDQTPDPQLPLPTAALQILNAGATLSDLADLPEPPPGGPLNGLFWSRGDYSGPFEGRGILVVHNPAFDPVKYEASRVAIEEGVLVEGFDPAYSHLDPSRQPARLGSAGGGSHSGVIIADAVGGISSAFTVIGALVTLTRSPQVVTAISPLRVIGSPTDIASAGRGALRHLTGFRPVAARAEGLGQCP